jgi:hypothetical protein
MDKLVQLCYVNELPVVYQPLTADQHTDRTVEGQKAHRPKDAVASIVNSMGLSDELKGATMGEQINTCWNRKFGGDPQRAQEEAKQARSKLLATTCLRGEHSWRMSGWTTVRDWTSNTQPPADHMSMSMSHWSIASSNPALTVHELRLPLLLAVGEPNLSMWALWCLPLLHLRPARDELLMRARWSSSARMWHMVQARPRRPRESVPTPRVLWTNCLMSAMQQQGTPPPTPVCVNSEYYRRLTCLSV